MCFDRNRMRRQSVKVNITLKKITHVALLVIVVAYVPELILGVVLKFLEKTLVHLICAQFLSFIQEYQPYSNIQMVRNYFLL